MHIVACILAHLLLSAAVLARRNHDKKDQAFDGPLPHEVLMGGLIDLPCYTGIANTRLMLNVFTSPGAYLYALKWVHNAIPPPMDPFECVEIGSWRSEDVQH